MSQYLETCQHLSMSSQSQSGNYMRDAPSGNICQITFLKHLTPNSRGESLMSTRALGQNLGSSTSR